ncbi:unnamed protein product [Ambrosiozyma monospora]|uniref:Unnamed protein product n=1 Tax=Ambrosiozyma monospora TaxID=43982 RepID=A0ACB5UBE8_AMBMO|nr:unnamed protein product [Ambrosiozyma monospora]
MYSSSNTNSSQTAHTPPVVRHSSSSVLPTLSSNVSSITTSPSKFNPLKSGSNNNSSRDQSKSSSNSPVSLGTFALGDLIKEQLHSQGQDKRSGQGQVIKDASPGPVEVNAAGKVLMMLKSRTASTSESAGSGSSDGAGDSGQNVKASIESILN